VALAAYARDPVLLAALRESVVLYAEMGEFSMLHTPKIEWRVDERLARQAARFVTAFNDLFPSGPILPAPTRENAALFWDSCDEDEVVGRCVRLGSDDRRVPVLHYHWAIHRDAGGGLEVEEFWRPEIWTTEQYRQSSVGSQ
jgi:hypothetical protein